ncbi:calcium/sodium antiporter [Gramella sp. GC03-9]|uniref:Calcium/sodium antiporter n=1 Tax=Christiangramia oceanisediminis TaxID=2920386 RepID=A0A9X2KYV7_9FLAO|nr:calcium/sodium antiporter [Gramella oceanisediminis]MCP9200850.1 calcium/sodium antiporter [Gramella oceanisediminis]
MLLSILLIVLGFISLIFGANWLVDGASALAKKYKVSDLAIGLTIVAFGTSAPELVVNVIASLNSYSDIVLGNIIGSNNFNLFIILGLAALIYPIKVQSSTAWKEIPISLFITILLVFLLNDFNFSENTFLSRLDAIILLVLFLVFLYYVFLQMKRDSTVQDSPVPLMSPKKTWIYIILGLGGLILGGHLVVTNSIEVASSLGVSEKIIGLTIVAAGTSLPELVTSAVSAFKKNSDIAIGNVIGSNIFNIMLILSISSLVNPLTYNPRFNMDLGILIGGTIFLLLFMLTGEKKKLDRWEAAILFGFYVIYTTYLVLQEF